MAVIVMLVIAGVIVLVGLVGLVLLIVGLAKKRTALWVCGIIAMVLAGMALLVSVPLVLRLVSSRHAAAARATSRTVEAGLHEGGCSITQEDGRVMVHVEGIKIEVVEPGSVDSHSSSQSSGGLLSGSRDARHEIGVGNVEILVETHGRRTTLTVNGRPCGPIHPGDSVVITPEREVLVNDQRRQP
jgi:hypothetical protein